MRWRWWLSASFLFFCGCNKIVLVGSKCTALSSVVAQTCYPCSSIPVSAFEEELPPRLTGCPPSFSPPAYPLARSVRLQTSRGRYFSFTLEYPTYPQLGATPTSGSFSAQTNRPALDSSNANALLLMEAGSSNGGQSPTAEGKPSAGGNRKTRSSIACAACRKGKERRKEGSQLSASGELTCYLRQQMRCEPNEDGAPCRRCANANLSCVWEMGSGTRNRAVRAGGAVVLGYVELVSGTLTALC